MDVYAKKKILLNDLKQTLNLPDFKTWRTLLLVYSRRCSNGHSCSGQVIINQYYQHHQ